MEHSPAAPLGTQPAAPSTAGRRERAERFYRHRLPVRVMHWINVVCMTVLLMSGLTIFNAHPALYWGHDSSFERPWISIRAEDGPNGPVGKTRIAGATFDTTGVLGWSESGGSPTARAFPSWATIPSRGCRSVGAIGSPNW